MRTKYFIEYNSSPIRFWRFKNGEMTYYHMDFQGSCRNVNGGTRDGEKSTNGWKQITRDEARKLETKAFR